MGPKPEQPTVFLACAAEDVASMSTLVRELVRQGIGIQVVGGVDLDTRPLEEALERARGRFLWVLCRSAELDAYQLELLRAALAQASVPDPQVLEVSFDPRAPFAFVGDVKRRLHQLGFSSSVPTASTSRSTLLGVPGQGALAPRPARTNTDRLTFGPMSSDLSGSTMVAPCPGRWKRVAIRSAATLSVFAAAWVLIGTIHAQGEASVAGVADQADQNAAPVAECEKPSSVEDAPPAVELDPGVLELALTEPPVEPRDDRAHDHAHGQDPTAQLEEAFEQRRIRGLDLLLITYPSRKSLTQATAHKACASTAEGGLEQWRLPTQSELATLAQGGFVAKYTMWWTATDESSGVRTMWTGARTLVKPSARRSRAKVLCVTDRPR
jgi:hypothetical protein